jgi:HSP90 family molecular chaperone
MAKVSELKDRELQKIAKATEALESANEAVLLAKALADERQTDLDRITEAAQRNIEAIDLVVRLHQEAIEEESFAPYSNLLQEDAMRNVLLAAKRKMNGSEMADSMKHGGYIFRSADPPNAIVVAANTNKRGYFTTEKEGNRTLIGLREWNENEQKTA